MMITKILPLVTYQKNIRTYKIFQDVIQQKLSKSIHKLIKKCYTHFTSFPILSNTLTKDSHRKTHNYTHSLSLNFTETGKLRQ